MKKFLIILLIITAFVYSCKKSNSSPPSIVGKWLVTVDSTTINQQTDIFFRYNAPYLYIQFNSDGTGQQSCYYPSLPNFTYSVSPGKVFINYPAGFIPPVTTGPFTDTVTVVNLTPGNTLNPGKLELAHNRTYSNGISTNYLFLTN